MDDDFKNVTSARVLEPLRTWHAVPFLSVQRPACLLLCGALHQADPIAVKAVAAG
ncbi:hypothetical protein [Leisingera sp. NJS204]|uniref:hypothetical protein n=1 Tax=Leisingera sp. NJS204 TaxID=2508307 RepID=UPI0013E91E09|nr:hypothetical protein [Leisingera sp. NJS204]